MLILLRYTQVNIARGEIAERDAVVEAVESGQLGGYAGKLVQNCSQCVLKASRAHESSDLSAHVCQLLEGWDLLPHALLHGESMANQFCSSDVGLAKLMLLTSSYIARTRWHFSE